MRPIVIAWLLAGVGGAVAHPLTRPGDDQPLRFRKSLGFGPAHPHARYHSNPYKIATNGFMPMHPDSDPIDVAKAFVEDILAGQLSSSKHYKIRKDSYTDAATGITHVYVRQMIHGLEVADGDININIKNGMVISYGSSFFAGEAPQLFSNPDASNIRQPHDEFCDVVSTELKSHVDEYAAFAAEGQTVLGDRERIGIASEMLAHAHATHCGTAKNAQPQSSTGAELEDPRHALLQFMLAATPNVNMEQDILSNWDSHVSGIQVTSTDSFGPDGQEKTLHLHNVPDALDTVNAKLRYIQVPTQDGTTALQLVWKFEVEMQDNWYESAVSATAPHRIISVVDWASDAYAAPIPPSAPKSNAAYNVFPWGINDPADGNRSIVKENNDLLASPAGWHAIPYANDPSLAGVRINTKGEFYHNTTTTWGNNVFAQENWEGQNSYIDNYRPDAGKDRTFDYPYAPKETDRSDAQDEAHKHINATVTQLFYTANMVHDLYYRYGWDEVAGNFQQYNFGRGGEQNDGVICNAQDGSGYNNANFMTPPDGQNGRMRMYLWNTALPFRDGDFEAGIVIHEFSHGLSTRLTGGPANSGCLGWGESGGMGEGWGDFLATTIRATSEYSDYPMGAWAANREGGIRNYPYSLNNTVNPSTYKTLDKPGYWGVHAIGEVWAQMLWVVEQRLIAVHGYSDELYPPLPLENGTIPEGDFYRPRIGKQPLVPKHGNTLIVQLVLNGMKLQPCRPSFFDARDAIIQADQELTGGENFCTLWKAFGERGLGQDAKLDGMPPWAGIRTDGFKVPTICQD